MTTATDRNIEVAFDEYELVVLWTVMDMRCQRFPVDIKRTALRDKLAESLRRLRSMPDHPKKKTCKTCPKCGAAAETFTADLDWCPICKHQWPGT